MNGRRIKLDLSDFVLDLGSQRWMFLSENKFSTVSDLVEHLKNEYCQLEDEDMVQVFMDGNFVIPPWESIEILQSGDLVKVIRVKQNKNNQKGKETHVEIVNKTTVKQSKENISIKRKKTTDSVENSGNSYSGSAEDITSKVIVLTPVKKTNQVKVLPKPIADKQKVISSSDSSDSISDESELDLKKKPKVGKKNVEVAKKSVSKTYVVNTTPATKKKSTESSSSSDTESSSDTSSDESDKGKTLSGKNNVLTPQLGSTPLATRQTNVSDKPKRKRKRKNKNKNKLSPDQVLEFESNIVPTEAAIRHSENINANNMHVRFDNVNEESDGMDVETASDKAEEFTAEQIRLLYSQSVSSPQVRNGTDSKSTKNGTVVSAKNAIDKSNCHQERHDKPVVPSIRKQNKTLTTTPVAAVNCEDVLMKQFDEKNVTNNAVVNKTAPKIVFKPRILNMKEMKKDVSANGNFQLSNQTVPDMSQFSALLNCKGEVFNKNTGLKDVYSNTSVVMENKDYSAYHEVSGTGPRVGDVIAFKVVEMGENYAPEVSDFKEGKVLECDGTNTVTFELIKMTQKRMAGKFEMEDDSEDNEKIKTFNWADLLDPRLVFP